MSRESRIKDIALSHGALLCGVAPAGPMAEHERFLRAASALPPSLSYLSSRAAVRRDPRLWSAGARSVLVCAFPYPPPHPEYRLVEDGSMTPAEFIARRGLRTPAAAIGVRGAVARYARGEDYHAWTGRKLAAILEGIRGMFPGAEGRAFCDTSPLLEKELGRLAGIGFRGRNTLLVNRRLGSYFILGGLALDIELAADAPDGGDCGSCRLCELACPAGALAGGGLDAAKCISYMTTQAKEKTDPPRDCGRAYGCDICQEACPFNEGRG